MTLTQAIKIVKSWRQTSGTGNTDVDIALQILLGTLDKQFCIAGQTKEINMKNQPYLEEKIKALKLQIDNCECGQGLQLFNLKEWVKQVETRVYLLEKSDSEWQKKHCETVILDDNIIGKPIASDITSACDKLDILFKGEAIGKECEQKRIKEILYKKTAPVIYTWLKSLLFGDNL